MSSVTMPTPLHEPSYDNHADLAADLPRLRRQLEDQRRFRLDQLAQLAAVRGQAQIEIAGRHLEDLDASADNARIEVSAAVEAAAQRALDDIDAALDRMRAGRYGNCDQCGRLIPVDRLYAIPQAGRCMDCQRRAESRR